MIRHHPVAIVNIAVLAYNPSLGIVRVTEMELIEPADSSLTARRRARAAALKGGGPKAQKSRITNGRQLLLHGNGTAWARRCRDLIALHRSDIPEPSHAVESLIRRIAVHEVQLEQLEQRFAIANEAGQEVDAAELDLYVRASGNLRRLLESVGLQRHARDISGTLSFRDRLDAEVEDAITETVDAPVNAPVSDIAPPLPKTHPRPSSAAGSHPLTRTSPRLIPRNERINAEA